MGSQSCVPFSGGQNPLPRTAPQLCCQEEKRAEHWRLLSCPCISSLIALFNLIVSSGVPALEWERCNKCRIIPSCRNLSITSVTGTQRLLLAQELTSIREQESKLSPCFHSLLPKDSRTLHKQKLIIIHTHTHAKFSKNSKPCSQAEQKGSWKSECHSAIYCQPRAWRENTQLQGEKKNK